jgi:hypothetical protein
VVRSEVRMLPPDRILNHQQLRNYLFEAALCAINCAKLVRTVIVRAKENVWLRFFAPAVAVMPMIPA